MLFRNSSDFNRCEWMYSFLVLYFHLSSNIIHCKQQQHPYNTIKPGKRTHNFIKYNKSTGIKIVCWCYYYCYCCCYCWLSIVWNEVWKKGKSFRLFFFIMMMIKRHWRLLCLRNSNTSVFMYEKIMRKWGGRKNKNKKKLGKNLYFIFLCVFRESTCCSCSTSVTSIIKYKWRVFWCCWKIYLWFSIAWNFPFFLINGII